MTFDELEIGDQFLFEGWSGWHSVKVCDNKVMYMTSPEEKFLWLVEIIEEGHKIVSKVSKELIPLDKVVGGIYNKVKGRT